MVLQAPDETEAAMKTVDAQAVEVLGHIFKSERIPDIIRRPASAFGGRRAIDLIREGRIAEVLAGYEKATTYQG
jgi:hypothetical protein